MTSQSSLRCLKPSVVLGFALSLLPALRLESAAGYDRARNLSLISVSDTPAAAASSRIRDLIATGAARRNWLEPGVRPLFDAIWDMASWYSTEMGSISYRFSEVESHLALVDRTLPEDQSYSAAHGFCQDTLGQLNGDFNGKLDLLAGRASKAEAEARALQQDVLDGSPSESQAQEAIDDADRALDARSVMERTIDDVDSARELALRNVDDGVLGEVTAADDSYCQTFGPSQWEAADPRRDCQPYADVSVQTQNALHLLSVRVERDPWLDVSPSHRNAALASHPTMRRLSGEIGNIIALLPDSGDAGLARAQTDLWAAWADVLAADYHVVNLGPSITLAEGARKGQEVIEAARAMTKAIGELKAALRELEPGGGASQEPTAARD